MKISSKVEMYALQKHGLLGNCLLTWTWEEFLDSTVEGDFGLRHRSKSGSPLFKRKMDRGGMTRYVNGLLDSRKITAGEVVISQDTLLYDGCRTLQGEVCLSPVLTLEYSGVLCTQFSCREEMRQVPMSSLKGLVAEGLLRTFLDAPSWDFLQELLSNYQDATVEFTSFSRSVGSLGWNTIFWEVRDY